MNNYLEWNMIAVFGIVLITLIIIKVVSIKSKPERMMAMGVIIVLLTIFNIFNYFEYGHVRAGGVLLEILAFAIYLVKGGYTDLCGSSRE